MYLRMSLHGEEMCREETSCKDFAKPLTVMEKRKSILRSLGIVAQQLRDLKFYSWWCFLAWRSCWYCFVMRTLVIPNECIILQGYIWVCRTDWNISTSATGVLRYFCIHMQRFSASCRLLNYPDLSWHVCSFKLNV